MDGPGEIVTHAGESSVTPVRKLAERRRCRSGSEPLTSEGPRSMPTHYKDPVLVCDGCGTTTPRPAAGAWTPLHEEGWRWIGNQEQPLRFVPKTFLFSCPGCPRVQP
ncbi:hypothetical protein [Streptomyces sp. NPDC055036]